jgi:hypothetical protein
VSDHEPDRDRQQQILMAVLKFVGIVVGICLAIGLVTWVVVKSLDLNDDGTGTSNSVGPVQPITPLPTTALPSPTESDDPSDTASPSETDSIPPFATESPGSTALFLTASPVFVQSEERINLTGSWPGHDSVSLLVQRFENGAWANFGVQVEVDIGTFATYVQTGHQGDNKFRVYDPSSGTASNPVTVTVGE